MIEEYLTSFGYLYTKTLKDQEDRIASLGEEFLEMIEKSSKAYDRYE
jgi:hypothetical protein